MSPSTSVAASLSLSIRKELAIQVLTKTEPVSHLAAQHQVSRTFLYQQRHKADQALDEAFAESADDQAVRLLSADHPKLAVSADIGVDPHLPLLLSWGGGAVSRSL